MYLVVVGAGRVGTAIAGWLVSSGHEVTVVDTDRARVVAVEEELGSVAIAGDGTDVAVLTRAGANRADAMIATTSHDDTNLAVCQLGKHHFGVERTISRVSSRDNVQLFGRLDVDVSVDETELVLGRIQEALSGRGITHLMPVSGIEGKTLVALTIPRDIDQNGRAIKDLPLPDGTIISLIISRDGGVAVPQDDTVIYPGDEVVAVTTARYEEELRELLVGGNGE